MTGKGMVVALALAAICAGSMASAEVARKVAVAEAVSESAAGVRIVVLSPTGEEVGAEASTDAAGQAIFKGLKPGHYQLQIADGAPSDFEVPKNKSDIVVILQGRKHNYVGHVTLLR